MKSSLEVLGHGDAVEVLDPEDATHPRPPQAGPEPALGNQRGIAREHHVGAKRSKPLKKPACVAVFVSKAGDGRVLGKVVSERDAFCAERWRVGRLSFDP